MKNFLTLKFRLADVFVLTIAFLPIAYLGWMLLTYTVNVPVWDQWWVSETIVKAATGKLSFTDLMAQHNESRKFFPRLIYIVLAYLTKYDVRVESLLSFALTCQASLGLIWLSYLTVSRKATIVLGLAILTNLLLFSTIQYEAWLSGLSAVVYISIACIVSGLVMTHLPIEPKIQLILCAVLATISTFSFANGILAWLILCPPLLLFKSSNRKLLTGAWLLGLTINAVAYFYNYSKPAYHPSLTTSLIRPTEAIAYFLSFLGNPLGWGTILPPNTQSIIVGAILVVLYALICVYLIGKQYLWQRASAWLCLGSYGIFSALVATVGRVGFGSGQGMASRYTTFAVYSIVAVIYLVAIVLDDFKSRGREKLKNVIGYIAAGLVGVFITLHGVTAVHAAAQMQALYRERVIGKACLLFINVAPVSELIYKVSETLITTQIPHYTQRPIEEGFAYFTNDLSDCIESKLYWKSIAGIDFGGAERVRKTALALNSLGWLHPPLIESDSLKETSNNTGLNYGFFDTLQTKGDRQYLASGWAYLPQQVRPADAVALTYDTGAGAKVFKIVPVGEERADVQQAMHSDTYLRSGWRGEISAADIPKDTLRIEAWAFDVTTATAHKLSRGILKSRPAL